MAKSLPSKMVLFQAMFGVHLQGVLAGLVVWLSKLACHMEGQARVECVRGSLSWTPSERSLSIGEASQICKNTIDVSKTLDGGSTRKEEGMLGGLVYLFLLGKKSEI